MRVTVIGTGYVGLVTGVCLANSGHDVTCVDIDAAKVATLSGGTCTIYEPGLEEIMTSSIAAGRLRFSTPDAGWAPLLGEVVFVAVGTPSADNGSANLSYVRSAVQSVAAEATAPLTLVMKSTVPPGTGRTLIERYLDGSSAEIGYVSNPEFLREGHAVTDWYQTDRIVLGGRDESHIDKLAELYSDIHAPVLRTNIESAETIKYASNAFLSTKISFINEIANVCDFVGADIDAVSSGIGMDRRIGPDFLKAGIGYGGSCFPKDTRALDFISTINGYQFDLLKAVIDVNNRQRLLPVIHLARLGNLHQKKIAVLGVAFKPFTDDVRESPAVDIVPLLLELGASVELYDPVAAEITIPGANRVDSATAALTGASAAVLLTEWPEFLELDWSAAAAVMAADAVVFDGRNALDAAAVTAAGLRYMAVGRAGEHRDALV